MIHGHRKNPTGETIICTKCGLQKPLAEFHVRPTGSLFSWCIECKKVYDRTKRAADRARVKIFKEQTGVPQ